jgi:uncharacterized integral membrane protein
MRARTALLLLVLVALGIFTALNWTAITTPTDLHLVFWRVQAPLGVILLAFTAGVTLLYAVFLTWIETSAMLEGRRFTRELQAQRQLAETAEASRYTELRTHLQAELASLRTVAEGQAREVIARVDRAETQLRTEIEQSSNTLSAYFAELEDRLNLGERPAPPRTNA